MVIGFFELKTIRDNCFTKFSHKHFSDYLSNENSSTIFLQPTDKEEIANICVYLLLILIRFWPKKYTLL